MITTGIWLVWGTLPDRLGVSSPTLRFAEVGPDGQQPMWEMETPSIRELDRAGWKKSDLSVGDVIRISGALAKDGSLKVFAERVLLIASNGRTLASPRTLL